MTDDDSFQVRPLRRADHAAWLALWRGYQAFYRVEIAPAASELTWRRLHDPAEPVHGAVAAAANDRPVALVHWIAHRSTWTAADYCYLQDLYVSPEARRRGVARQVIEHVYEVAAQAGWARVYWLTHETNRDAMALYDRVADRSGFVQYRKTVRAAP